MLDNFCSREEYVNWFSRNYLKHIPNNMESNLSYTDKVKQKKSNASVIKKASRDCNSPVVVADTKVAKVSPCPFSGLNSGKQKNWVIRNFEVIPTNFENLRITTKLFAFDDWKRIRKMLKNYFQAKIVINPLIDENALISFDQGSIKDLINNEGKWQAMGSFHLNFERWDKHKQSAAHHERLWRMAQNKEPPFGLLEQEKLQGYRGSFWRT